MPEFDWDVHRRLTRYLSNTCSAAEAAELERWLAGDPARQAELDAFRRLWEASAGLPPSDRVDAMWRELASRVQGERNAVISREPTRPLVLQLIPHRSGGRGARWRWIIAIAAAGLIMAVGGGMWVRGSSDVMPRTGLFTAGGEVKEYRTRRGQRATVQLGDGTKIELGVASRLWVHPFTGVRRHVELEGEAVFEVVHDVSRPFTVSTRDVHIEDLGTRFGVRAYEGDSTIRVVVAEGIVAVRPERMRSDTVAVLHPGDLAVVDLAGTAIVRRGITVESYLGWTAGRIRFDNASLRQVADELERWYEVEISVDGPALAARRVTLDAPVGALVDILDAIVAPLGIGYVTDGNHVRLGTH